MEKSEGKRSMWLVFAVLSAVFAALTSILAKVGIDNVNSNLATAIRTLVVLVMAWVMVFATGAQAGLGPVSYTHLRFHCLSRAMLSSSFRISRLAVLKCFSATSRSLSLASR